MQRVPVKDSRPSTLGVRPALLVRVIDTDRMLASFTPRLRAAEWIALDTEADSLHAYPEKLCLIQISMPGADELVDPLAGLNLAPLWTALQGRVLVLHGADYDLRLLHKCADFVPHAVFDTMIAARLLGERRFGLSDLVVKYLGVTLEKGSQKADWARRPLTGKMMAYARNDTRYLQPLAGLLEGRLAASGRLDWLRESCERLVVECARPSVLDGDQVWRLKGSHHLSRGALAVLRELWRWREAEAIAANRPPFFILQHETLVALAIAAVGAHPFEPLVPKHLPERRRQGLREAVATGLALPENDQPDLLRPISRRLTEAEKRRFLELQARRDRRAADLVIDPTLIASKATLVSLAQDWTKHQRELMNWQRELLA